jgi:phage tail protein X
MLCNRPAYDTPDLGAVAQAAYQHLCGGVAAILPNPGLADIGAVWAIAHGLADLLSAGRLHSISSLPVGERDVVIAEIIGRALPAL